MATSLSLPISSLSELQLLRMTIEAMKSFNYSAIAIFKAFEGLRYYAISNACRLNGVKKHGDSEINISFKYDQISNKPPKT